MFKASDESSAEQQISPEVEEQLQQARDEATQTCKEGTATDCAVAWEEVHQLLAQACELIISHLHTCLLA